MLRPFLAFARAARVVVSISVVAGAIASAGFLSSCSDQSEQAGSRPPEGPSDQVLRDADENTWAQVLRAGTLGAFTDYLQNFPDGKHLAEARERIAALEAQARNDADERAWAVAREADTAAGFAEYLRDFPQGVHAVQAREREAVLEAHRRKEADETAWREAERSATLAAFEDYLREFANSTHAAQARQRLAALNGVKASPSPQLKAGVTSGKKGAANRPKPKHSTRQAATTGVRTPVYKAPPSNPWFRWFW